MATEMLAYGVAIVTGHCVPGADRDAADYIAALLNNK